MPLNLVKMEPMRGITGLGGGAASLGLHSADSGVYADLSGADHMFVLNGTYEEYGGLGNVMTPSFDEGSAIVYVAGVLNGGTESETFVAKLNLSGSGEILWQANYGDGAQYGEHCDIGFDIAGDLYVCGSSDTYGNLLMKLDKSNGDITWQRELDTDLGPYRGVWNSMSFLNADWGGHIYVGGACSGGGGGAAVLAKYNQSGTLLWQRNLGPQNDSAGWVGVYVDGNSKCHCVGYIKNNDGYKAAFAQYNWNGSLDAQKGSNDNGVFMGGIAHDSPTPWGHGGGGTFWFSGTNTSRRGIGKYASALSSYSGRLMDHTVGDCAYSRSEDSSDSTDRLIMMGRLSSYYWGRLDQDNSGTGGTVLAASWDKQITDTSDSQNVYWSQVKCKGHYAYAAGIGAGSNTGNLLIYAFDASTGGTNDTYGGTYVVKGGDNSSGSGGFGAGNQSFGDNTPTFTDYAGGASKSSASQSLTKQTT